jgi:hypothetical protein
MTVEPFRLITSIVTVAAVVLMILATTKVFRMADAMPVYGTIMRVGWVLSWINLFGWGYVTITRLPNNAPITDATIINFSVVLCTAASAIFVIAFDHRHRHTAIPH